MVDEERRVFWSQLRAQGVFYSKSVLSSLEERAFRQPSGREYLERVRVLAWLDELLLRRKLQNHLFHRNDLLHLSVEVFDARGGATDMAPFGPIELYKQVLGFKWPPNLDIDRPRNSVAGHEAKDVVVEVDVDGAVKVEA